MKTDDQLARIIWDYHVLGQHLTKSDCIIALGNSDIRTAERASQLFLDGYGQLLVTTGGYGRLTKGDFSKPEAEVFADCAVELGVPRDKILIEGKSSNTLDNLRFTQQHLEDEGISAESFIVVTKPYMERRAAATVKKLWPTKTIAVTSPKIAFENYPNDTISKNLFYNMLVGDLQRIILYGQTRDLDIQEVPEPVMAAYNELIRRGYSTQLTSQDKLPR